MTLYDRPLTVAEIVDAVATGHDLDITPPSHSGLDVLHGDFAPPRSMHGDLLRALVKTLPLEAFQIRRALTLRDVMRAHAGSKGDRAEVERVVGFDPWAGNSPPAAGADRARNEKVSERSAPIPD